MSDKETILRYIKANKQETYLPESNINKYLEEYAREGTLITKGTVYSLARELSETFKAYGMEPEPEDAQTIGTIFMHFLQKADRYVKAPKPPFSEEDKLTPGQSAVERAPGGISPEEQRMKEIEEKRRALGEEALKKYEEKLASEGKDVNRYTGRSEPGKQAITDKDFANLFYEMFGSDAPLFGIPRVAQSFIYRGNSPVPTKNEAELSDVESFVNRKVRKPEEMESMLRDFFDKKGFSTTEQIKRFNELFLPEVFETLNNAASSVQGMFSNEGKFDRNISKLGGENPLSLYIPHKFSIDPSTKHYSADEVARGLDLSGMINPWGSDEEAEAQLNELQKNEKLSELKNYISMFNNQFVDFMNPDIKIVPTSTGTKTAKEQFLSGSSRKLDSSKFMDIVPSNRAISYPSFLHLNRSPARVFLPEELYRMSISPLRGTGKNIAEVLSESGLLSPEIYEKMKPYTRHGGNIPQDAWSDLLSDLNTGTGQDAAFAARAFPSVYEGLASQMEEGQRPKSDDVLNAIRQAVFEEIAKRNPEQMRGNKYNISERETAHDKMLREIGERFGVPAPLGSSDPERNRGGQSVEWENVGKMGESGERVPDWLTLLPDSEGNWFSPVPHGGLRRVENREGDYYFKPGQENLTPFETERQYNSDASTSQMLELVLRSAFPDVSFDKDELGQISNVDFRSFAGIVDNDRKIIANISDPSITNEQATESAYRLYLAQRFNLAPMLFAKKLGYPFQDELADKTGMTKIRANEPPKEFGALSPTASWLDPNARRGVAINTALGDEPFNYLHEGISGLGSSNLAETPEEAALAANDIRKEILYMNPTFGGEEGTTLPVFYQRMKNLANMPDDQIANIQFNYYLSLMEGGGLSPQETQEFRESAQKAVPELRQAAQQFIQTYEESTGRKQISPEEQMQRRQLKDQLGSFYENFVSQKGFGLMPSGSSIGKMIRDIYPTLTNEPRRIHGLNALPRHRNFGQTSVMGYSPEQRKQLEASGISPFREMIEKINREKLEEQLRSLTPEQQAEYAKLSRESELLNQYKPKAVVTKELLKGIIGSSFVSAHSLYEQNSNLTYHPLHIMAHERDDSGVKFEYPLNKGSYPPVLTDHIDRFHGLNYIPHVHGERGGEFVTNPRNRVESFVDCSDIHIMCHRDDSRQNLKKSGAIPFNTDRISGGFRYGQQIIDDAVANHLREYHGYNYKPHLLVLPMISHGIGIIKSLVSKDYQKVFFPFVLDE